MTNNALNSNDVVALAKIHNILIRKRNVYIRPAVKMVQYWTKATPPKLKTKAVAIPLKRRGAFQHAGYLAKGVGTNTVNRALKGASR